MKNSTNQITWWQLVFTGLGCTIGTGFFLGSGIGLQLTGPSIVFSFLIATACTYIVFHCLASMSAADPQAGSFCYYAEKAFGKWAGFSCGWNYWISSILIMGSQLIGLALLTKEWFPKIELWIFAAGYAVLAIAVILLGTRGFDRIEDILAVIKTAAIVIFIILAIFVIAGGFSEVNSTVAIPAENWFSNGMIGFWSSLIYALYAFGGIEVIGLMTIRLKKQEDAPKTGQVMLGILAVLYPLSLLLAVWLLPVSQFRIDESPFVTVLSAYVWSIFPTLFNGAIIIAGFSTLTAALFGVVTLLVTMAEDSDAPRLFAKKAKAFKQLPLPSLLLATVGLVASVITALLLPDRIYEYITTAAGIMLLGNWTFIILSAWRLLPKTNITKKGIYFVGLLFICLAVTGTLLDQSIRPGFWICLLFSALIVITTVFIQKKWNKQENRA
ncbi:amino acid permease [Gracilibacillus caseinilyticus]|uniref:Amino acid permease n=1 Tax=Gracilibacillus caseinilyticus TaxID=2932256 RepID=A0ABY4F3P5_9BACI|nr:amino acid permease [Gracilibacillus caseinilyticus]UOQ49076.1 amino acid permease [Gracilibacillus caseinilyticus]